MTHIKTIIFWLRLWLWLWLWLSSLSLIDRFQSRGQQLCKLLGIKQSFNMWKEYNSQRIFFVHKHGRRFIVLYTNMAANSLFCTQIWPRIHCFVHKHDRRFIVLYTNMAAVTSCENDLFVEVLMIIFPGTTKFLILFWSLRIADFCKVLALFEVLFLSSDPVYKFFGITAARRPTANGAT